MPALVVVLLAVLTAVSWHYSNDVVVPDHSEDSYDIEVVSIASLPSDGEQTREATIELARNEETARPGVYGIEWDEGSAIVEEVVADSSATVTRRLRNVDGDLETGEKVRFDSYVFQGDPQTALGLDYLEVQIEGELGAMPAWQIGPDRNRRWAIVVHGINSSRRVVLPIAPTLLQSGLTTLAITYRDDIGAPSSPDGHHHMGLTEWRDLEAAVRYVRANGARELLLIGHSMGGAVVTQFLLQSPLAKHVSAMVLDSPALDWPATIAFGARQLGLPEIAAKPVEWMVGLRIDADWEQLDVQAQVDKLRLPTLLFHGDADERVPIEPSDEYAAALPDWVTYHRVPEAGHIRSWNVDPDLYERRLQRFIEATMPASRSHE